MSSQESSTYSVLGFIMNECKEWLKLSALFLLKNEEKKPAISQLKTGIMGWVEMFNKTNETKKNIYVYIKKSPKFCSKVEK